MNQQTKLSRVIKERIHVVLFLFLPLLAFSQEYKLHPELKGYDGCGKRKNPLACLENTLSSIEHDLGFYASLDRNGEAFYTAQYCLQIAYVYRQLGFGKKSLEYLVKAKDAFDKIDPEFDQQKTGVVGLVLVTELDEYCSMNSASECDEWFGVQQAAVSSSDKEAEERVETELINPSVMEQPIGGKVESSLLRSLEKFLAQNPISYEFMKTHASDSCVIHITHRSSNSEHVLDTYLEHSWHVKLVGQHLMGIAKEIKYDESVEEDHVDMTILVRPDSKDTVMFNDGKFYVYYKRP